MCRSCRRREGFVRTPRRSGAVVYLRFVTLRRDPWSRSLQGVIHAAGRLRDEGALTDPEEERVEEAFRWLRVHLPVPGCLGERANDRAICWFKPRARKPIARVWDLVAVLREHGRHVRLLTTHDPGLILYRDSWQVVAKPRRRRASY